MVFFSLITKHDLLCFLILFLFSFFIVSFFPINSYILFLYDTLLFCCIHFGHLFVFALLIFNIFNKMLNSIYKAFRSKGLCRGEFAKVLTNVDPNMSKSLDNKIFSNKFFFQKFFVEDSACK